MQANEQMHLADARASSLVVWRKKSRLQAVLNHRAAYSFSFFSHFLSFKVFFLDTMPPSLFNAYSPLSQAKP